MYSICPLAQVQSHETTIKGLENGVLRLQHRIERKDSHEIRLRQLMLIKPESERVFMGKLKEAHA